MIEIEKNLEQKNANTNNYEKVCKKEKQKLTNSKIDERKKLYEDKT